MKAGGFVSSTDKMCFLMGCESSLQALKDTINDPKYKTPDGKIELDAISLTIDHAIARINKRIKEVNSGITYNGKEDNADENG